MGDKIATVLTAGITAVAAVAIFTHKATAQVASSLGGIYVGALKQIRLAAG